MVQEPEFVSLASGFNVSGAPYAGTFIGDISIGMIEGQSLLEWADRQPEWVRDALRRHAVSRAFQLSDDDKAAIIERARYAAGVPGLKEPDCVPLNADNLNLGHANSPRALLCSLGPVANLGRLASGQKLSFALDGITVIYGDNGSGKSGYCRIAKRLCRSLTSDDLLGNVFEPGEKPPVSVVVRYEVDGQGDIVEETWVDGTPPPSAVGNISVFDSRNAQFYVDQRNQIGFLPAEISLLEAHGSHRKEMESIFQSERKVLESRCKVPLPGGYTPGGKVETLLGNLTLKTRSLPSADDVQALAAWTEDDAKRLAALEVSLANDPTALAARCERSAAALSVYSSTLTEVASVLGRVAAEGLEAKARAAASATAAADLAADDTFATEPLPNVGHSPWRLMYDHAVAYIVSNGSGSELPSTEGDLCALCQQPLSAEASDRLDRFRQFVRGEAAAAADAARSELTAAVEVVRSLQLPTEASITQALAEYGSISEARSNLAEAVISYFAAAHVRKSALLAAVETKDFSDVKDLPDSISERLGDEVIALKSEAENYHEQAKAGESRIQIIAHLNDLKDQKLLHNNLAMVLARRDDLEGHAHLLRCEKIVGTLPVSNAVTSIRRKLVTEGLENRIAEEIRKLDLAHMPFVVSDQSRDGRSLFEVGIKAHVATANDKVLSEGEQRALALACFLAEVAADKSKNGLILDDPVSSLDHLRIRRVAGRLCAEAEKGRQVIVFTHNMLFYNELIDAAGSAQVPLTRRVITKSSADGFGLVSEKDEPWIVQKVTERIARLQKRVKNFDGITDFDGDDYRRAAKDFYTDLRETWGRLVEELLLGKVVERFNTDVRTQSLKGVVVEDEDYSTIYWAMKRVSERSGHDMAAGKGIPAPAPDDMRADLSVIETFRASVSARKNKISKVREALEKSPEGRVA